MNFGIVAAAHREEGEPKTRARVEGGRKMPMVTRETLFCENDE